MRGKAIGATVGAAALLAVTPGVAQARELRGPLSLKGGFTISWHGDPARGCAAAGLCSYRGSLTATGEYGEYALAVARDHVSDDFSYFELTTAPLVRVRRTDAGPDDGVCLDVGRTEEFGMTTADTGDGRARMRIDSSGLSTERCAGPNLARAFARLPRPTVPVSRLGTGKAVADFSGSAPFSAGRFSGTITSTLRIHLGRSRRGTFTGSESRPPPRPGRRRKVKVRVVQLHEVYRITDLSGKLSTSFNGLTGPPCADLDLCGVAGTSDWALRSAGGALVVDGEGLARRSDRGLRGALAALTRQHAAYVEVRRPNFFGTTTADVARAGGAPCHDTARARAPGLSGSVGAKRLRLVFGGYDAIPTDADLVRAGCPGPRDGDVLDNFELGAGSVPASRLTRPSFKLSIDGGRRFGRPAFSGSSTTRFTVALRRRSVHVRYRHLRVVR